MELFSPIKMMNLIQAANKCISDPPSIGRVMKAILLQSLVESSKESPNAMVADLLFMKLAIEAERCKICCKICTFLSIDSRYFY